MNSVQGQYMRIKQMLMCLIGQWPYQETCEKFLIQIIFVPAVFSQAVIQINSCLPKLLLKIKLVNIIDNEVTYTHTQKYM